MSNLDSTWTLSFCFKPNNACKMLLVFHLPYHFMSISCILLNLTIVFSVFLHECVVCIQVDRYLKYICRKCIDKWEYTLTRKLNIEHATYNNKIGLRLVLIKTIINLLYNQDYLFVPSNFDMIWLPWISPYPSAQGSILRRYISPYPSAFLLPRFNYGFDRGEMWG